MQQLHSKMSSPLRPKSPSLTPSTPRKGSPIDDRFDLTPRSKIRAMIAQFDSDDEGNDEEGIRKPVMKRSSHSDQEMQDGGDSEEGGEGLIPRPSKRSTGPMDVSDNKNEKEEENAVERPKKGLVAMMDASDDDDDDEPVAVVRPRKGIVSRTQTSDGGAQKRESEGEGGAEVAKEKTTRHVRLQSASQKRGPFSQRESDEESSDAQFSTSAKSPSTSTKDTQVTEDNDSDADLPKDPTKNARFLELVERKRRERLEKEAEEQLRRQERLERAAREADYAAEDDYSDDEETQRKTQKRPSRAAGKKAMEEMARETQRIARNMQLAHEAKTKMRIEKQSVFKKFGFQPANANTESPSQREKKQSALEAVDQQQLAVDPHTDRAMSEPKATEEEPLTAEAILAQALAVRPIGVAESEKKEEEEVPPRLDKGKGKALDVPTPEKKTNKTDLTPKLARVAVANIPDHTSVQSSATDSVPQTRKEKYTALQARKLALLEEAARQKKAKELAAKEAIILELRKRSRTVGPKSPKAKQKKRLSPNELATELLRKSREQALQEREERIEELKARGIIVQTAEERARDHATVEEQLEKARLEAERIKKKEQREQRLEKIRNGEMVIDDEEEEDEEDIKDGDWLDEEQGELYELSGSDQDIPEEENGSVNEGSEVSDFSDEEEGTSEDDKEGEDEFERDMERKRFGSAASMIADEAEEDDDGGTKLTFSQLPSKTRRSKRVIDEDDEDADSMDIDELVPGSASKNPFAAFLGLESDPAPLGLTQMFQGTMADDSQPFELLQKSQPGVSKLDFLRKAPVDELPNSQAPLDFGGDEHEVIQDAQPGMQIDDLQYDQSQEDAHSSESEEEVTRINGLSKSQEGASFPQISLDYSQSEVHTEEDNTYPSTQSQFPNPTPDVGFTTTFEDDSRFGPPPSTIASEVHESTQVIPKKPRRLMKKTEIGSSDEEISGPANAFDVMKRAAKKAKEDWEMEAFDKEKSKAKEMVDEQAEESEDEWAGLGGASDDEDDNHDQVELEKMIDDSVTKVDEDAIKAYYAEKERKDDERHVTKLFRDLQNGGLRRKRNAEFDLSDSEDEEERRRAIRRRNEARMRKLILEDTNVSQIAANPKRSAFLACLEDNDEDDSKGFLDQVDEDLYASLGTPTSEELVKKNPTAPIAEGDAAPDASQSDADSFAAGPKLPRSRVSRKKNPNLVEIRETLSFLVEDDDKEIANLSDSDDEMGEVGETLHTTAITATRKRTTRIIDRIELKRTASAMTSETSTTTKMAFAAPDDKDTVGFRGPPLLRRAATNSQLSDSASTTSTTSGAAGQQDYGVQVMKNRGSASTSINFYQKESQKEKVVSKLDEKRKAKLLSEARKRTAEAKKRNPAAAGGVLGLLAKGSFT